MRSSSVGTVFPFSYSWSRSRLRAASITASSEGYCPVSISFWTKSLSSSVRETFIRQASARNEIPDKSPAPAYRNWPRPGKTDLNNHATSATRPLSHHRRFSPSDPLTTGDRPLFSLIMRPPSYRQRLFIEHDLG